MAFVPRDAEWYIAEIVQRITVQGDRRTVVHVNVCLVRARDPDEAHAKAIALGKGGETAYVNPRGRRVEIAFLGLRDLNVVHEPLEDGAEILFEEHVGLDRRAIRRLVRERDELAVFRPIRRSRGPDYGAADVMAEVERELGASHRPRKRTK
jgi:hypothetical protein